MIMDNPVLEKVFVRLDECSTAAENLSKSFNKFNTSSKKLEENIKKIVEFDQNLKDENTLKDLSSATVDIKKLMDYFNETLPDLKQDVLDSKNNLFENKEIITQATEELIRFKDEISEVAIIVEYLKEIRESTKEIASLNIHQDVEQLQGIAEKYTTLTSEIKVLLHENVRYLIDQFKEFQDIKDEIKKEVEVVQDFRKELNEINYSIQVIKDGLTEKDKDIAEEVLSLNHTLTENNTALKSLLEEIPLSIQNSQVNLDRQMRAYIDELLKEYIGNFEEKLNQKNNNIVEMINEKGKSELMDQSQPTTIENLYKKNNKKLPIKVQKVHPYQWSTYYHFVIETVKEMEGELKAIGKAYIRDQINKEREIRPLMEDGFIIYLDE